MISFLNEKKTNSKKLNSKTKSLLDNTKKYQEVRLSKKIWLWLILLPPVGIYKSIKYKAFSKLTTIFLIIIMFLSLIVGIDTILYPNRILDYKISKAVEDYEDIGSVRAYSKQSNLNNSFIVYNVITTKGEYDIYFSGDGKLTIEGINQISPEKQMIYKSKNIPNELNNVYAEIIRFFNEKNSANEYGKIIGCTKDKLENHQIIITDKGKYAMSVKYGQVSSIFKINNNGEREKIVQRYPQINMPQDVIKSINKNKKTIGDIKEVYEYNITNDSIEYLFTNKENIHYKIIKYNDGSMKIFKGDVSSIN